jgi:hypothetical protein
MQTFREQSTDWKCSFVLGKFATTESAVSPNDHNPREIHSIPLNSARTLIFLVIEIK